MDGAITLNLLIELVALAGALGALWYRVETRISKGAVDAMAKAESAHDKLHVFELEVAENYVKASLMKDVETRILDEIKGMRRDFSEGMKAIGTTSRGRGRS